MFPGINEWSRRLPSERGEAAGRHTPSPAPCSQARFGRGAVGSSCCYAMHKLTTHSRWPGPAPGVIATRPSQGGRRDPGSAGDAPPPAGGGRPVCRPRTLPVPPLRRRVVGDGSFEPDSKQASVFHAARPSLPAWPRIGAATHTHSSDSNLSYTPALQWGLRTNGFARWVSVVGAACQHRRLPPRPLGKGSYLVDPASSHMLVSKIKPCMSKYKLLYTVKLRMAH